MSRSNSLTFYFKRSSKKINRNIVYNSLWVQKFINNLKSHIMNRTIEKLFYASLIQAKQFYKVPIPILLFKFIKTQKLLFKIAKVRKAGRLYQVPIGFNEFNRYALPLRSTIKQLRNQRTATFMSKLLTLLNINLISQNTPHEKSKNEIYSSIVAYRGYLHYRWRL